MIRCVGCCLMRAHGVTSSHVAGPWPWKILAWNSVPATSRCRRWPLSTTWPSASDNYSQWGCRVRCVVRLWPLKTLLKVSSTPLSFCASIQLGSGHFAHVKTATWRKENGEAIDVAVKMMNSDAEFEKIRFLQEAVMMGQFSHPNVLQIYGVIKDEHVDNLVGKIAWPYIMCLCVVLRYINRCWTLLQLMLVTELMTKGDLHTYLKSLKLE